MEPADDRSTPSRAPAQRAADPFAIARDEPPEPAPAESAAPPAESAVAPEPTPAAVRPPSPTAHTPLLVVGALLLLGLGLLAGRQTAPSPAPQGSGSHGSKAPERATKSGKPQAPPTPPPVAPRVKARQLADQAWRDLRQVGTVAALYTAMFWKSASDDDRLLVACRHGRADLAKALLAAGGSVNAVDFADDRHPAVYRVGATPLSLAIESGKMDLVRLLLDKGANVEQRDASHDTILLRAIREGHEELARLLLDSGADALARNDRSNESAYGLAFGRNMPRLRSELERRGGHF